MPINYRAPPRVNLWTKLLRAYTISRYTRGMNTKKYFLYVRKSTDDTQRQMRSLEDQTAETQEMAARLGLEFIKMPDEKRTAKVPGRPIFNEMLDRIEGGEAQGILAWHPDRLSRNSLDGGRIIHLLDTGKLVDLKFCTYWFENNPHGKLMLAFAFGMSKYYVDKLSVDIKRGLNGKVAAGIWPQFSAIGYLNDPVSKTIVPDPVRAPLIRSAFEVYASGGVTLDRLKAIINGLGLTSRPCKKSRGLRESPMPLSRAQYHRLLRNPIYCGLMRYRGELSKGSHQPIISKELFDKVQAIIAGKRKPREKKLLKNFAYRGLFRCGECGGMITTELQKGHHYLRCTKKLGPCKQRYVREEDVTRQVNLCLGTIAFSQDAINWMASDLSATRFEESTCYEDHLSSFRQKLTGIDQKIGRLTTAYAENVLNLDEYRQAKNVLVEEKATLQSQSDRVGKNPLSWLEPAEKFLTTLSEATLALSSNDPNQKAKFLKKTGSNQKIQDKTLQIEFNEPLKIVENYGRFAQPETRAAASAARGAGETNHFSHLAERGRFELPLPLRADRFSKPARSAAPPPLRGGRESYRHRLPASKRPLWCRTSRPL
jgi:site-specific DNA recombinase